MPRRARRGVSFSHRPSDSAPGARGRETEESGRAAQDSSAMPVLNSDTPLVGVVMGSRSDWETLRHATEVLAELGIPYEAKVVSAHRTPERLYQYGREAEGRGLAVLIAGAGGAAH